MSYTINELYWSYRHCSQDKSFADFLDKTVTGVPITEVKLIQLLEDYDSKALLLRLDAWDGPRLRKISSRIVASLNRLWQYRSQPIPHSEPVEFPRCINGYYDLQEGGLIKMYPASYHEFKEWRQNSNLNADKKATFTLGEKYDQAVVIGVRKETLCSLESRFFPVRS